MYRIRMLDRSNERRDGPPCGGPDLRQDRRGADAHVPVRAVQHVDERGNSRSTDFRQRELGSRVVKQGALAGSMLAPSFDETFDHGRDGDLGALADLDQSRHSSLFVLPFVDPRDQIRRRNLGLRAEQAQCSYRSFLLILGAGLGSQHCEPALDRLATKSSWLVSPCLVKATSQCEESRQKNSHDDLLRVRSATWLQLVLPVGCSQGNPEPTCGSRG